LSDEHKTVVSESKHSQENNKVFMSRCKTTEMYFFSHLIFSFFLMELWRLCKNKIKL